MRTHRWTLVGSLALLLALPVLADEAKTSNGFDRLKSLVGDWEGKAPDGKMIKVSYRLTSGGSALAETLQVSGEPEMLTIYHPDGRHLMMTHYCSMGNQPRMRAEAGADSSSLAFHYFDGTNLSGPEAPHMDALTIRFEDANHITEEWVMKGGSVPGVTLHIQRKK